MLDTVALPCFNGIMDGERKAQKLPKIWNGFDPQLQVRVRSGRIAASVPEAWLPCQDRELLGGLIGELVERRRKIRRMLLDTIARSPARFTGWAC